MPLSTNGLMMNFFFFSNYDAINKAISFFFVHKCRLHFTPTIFKRWFELDRDIKVVLTEKLTFNINISYERINKTNVVTVVFQDIRTLKESELGTLHIQLIYL